MRIAVLSDTHNHLPGHVIAAIAEADEIWHLGDVCLPATIDPLTHLGPPLRVVRGNCDMSTDWPLTLDFVCEGFRIRLEHVPPRQSPKGIDLLFHGHTHVPRNERFGTVRYFNPGCITRPNRGAPASYAWLYLERGQPLRWTLVTV